MVSLVVTLTIEDGTFSLTALDQQDVTPYYIGVALDEISIVSQENKSDDFYELVYYLDNPQHLYTLAVSRVDESNLKITFTDRQANSMEFDFSTNRPTA